MKNLVLLGERRHRVALGQDEDELAGVCRLPEVINGDGEDDGGSDRVVLTKRGVVARIRNQGSSAPVVVWECDLEAAAKEEDDDDEEDQGINPTQECPSPSSPPPPTWFHVTYVDPADAIVCISRGGAVLTVSPESGAAELVGVFDNGVEAAAWSSDREVLLLVTTTDDEDEPGKKNSVLLTLNSQWEVLAEVQIEPFVSSFSKEKYKVDGPSAVSATWRPDGTLCAVSALDATDGMRKVRFYKRDTLELHAIGLMEDASGKLVKNIDDWAGMAWANGGCSQLLATVQRKSKRVTQVIFFEPNGLRHREFDLKEPSTTIVLGLCWNSISDLLCVSLRDEQAGVDKCQLWHRSNYHWYLTQEFRFYHNRQILGTSFEPNNQSKLFILLDGMEWREYEIRWDASAVQEMSNGACLANVIDGKALKLTNLAQVLVPPPMCQFTLEFSCTIREVAFCNPRDEGKLRSVVLLSNGELALVLQDGAGELSIQDALWVDKNSVDCQTLRSLHMVGKVDTETIYAIAISCADCGTTQERVVEIKIKLNDNSAKAIIRSALSVGGRALRCCTWLDSPDGALIQLRDGRFVEYTGPSNDANDSDEPNLRPLSIEPFLEPCPQMMAIKDISAFVDLPDTSVLHGNNRLIVGLSKRSRLYCQDLMLTDSASSFALSTTHQYLCYITAGSQCHIRFLPFADILQFDPFMGADQNHIFAGYEPRAVERGSRLVAVPPSKPMAVLQMPRGNLEGIYPRALVIRYVLRQVDEGKYREAFELMRRQKIDTNLMVDIDPWHFLDVGIHSVFDQIVSIDYLNLFISALCNWDVTQSRFSIPPWLRPKSIEGGKGDFDFSFKVNQICQKARSIMMSMQDEKVTPSGREVPGGYFLLPILSTFAREHPPQLEQALTLVKSNALKQLSKNSRNPPLFSETAQSSIHYLAFLAEYALLFETALGMYDFDLARAVARNSQMDPKTYLPLLKRLKSLPGHYARYEVDVRLRRNEAALENLVNSFKGNEKMESSSTDTAESILSSSSLQSPPINNSFEDCRELVKKHNLYRLGLELLGDDAGRRRCIMGDLGEHLLSTGQIETALSIFMTMDPPFSDGAIRASRECGNWRCFFSLIATNGEGDNNDGKIRLAAQEIAKKIVSNISPASSRVEISEAYASAARILLDYADDLDGAVDQLLAGELWLECYRITTRSSRPALMKKCVNAAVDHATSTIVNLQERVSQFTDATEKYADALAARKEKVAVDGPLDEGETTETGSLFSSASNVSNTSLRSYASASSTGSSLLSINTAATKFALTGKDATDRHRSKFNHGAKRKKQKKPHKPKRTKVQPGSAEALQEAVGTLKSSFLDEEYCKSVCDVISFLLLRQKAILARQLYDTYLDVSIAINRIQEKRVAAAREVEVDAERMSSRNGEYNAENNGRNLRLSVEDEVDGMSCPPLAAAIQNYFEQVPLEV